MPLDPVIAGGFRGLQLQDPLEQYARANQLLQAQQQNQLNALKMQEYQREREAENKLAQLFQRPGADPTSPEFMREVYGISPLKGAAFQKSALETQKAQREADAAAEKLAAERVAGARALLPSVTPETWGAWREDTIRKLPGLASMIPEAYSEDARLRLMQTADQYLAERKPLVVSPGASVYRPGTTTPMFTAPAAERPYEPSETQKILADLKNPALTPQEKAGLEARLSILTTREPKEPREPREPSAPIAVVDDATGKIKYVPREEAIGKTPASALEGLAPKEIQKREAAFPQATSAIKGVEANADTFIKDLRALRNHPGLDGITGMVFGRTASAKGASREAQALYDKIVAKGGFQMLQAMREASKTGGALGNVSNEEGRRLQAAFAAIDRVQDADSVRRAIDGAIAEIEGAKARSREAYESTYEYKQRGGGGGAAAPKPGVDASNPLLK